MNNSKKFLLVLIFFYFLGNTSVFSQDKTSQKTKIEQEIIELSQSGGILLQTPKKKILFQHQAKSPFIPASVIKIIISSAAFDLLGEDFRFSTQFYKNKEQNLLVRGGGDPFFISEEIEKIAIILKEKGFSYFQSIFLDDSLIETLAVPGLGTSNNSYDALNGALVVNFNSLYLQKDSYGKILSAEAWTPLTPLAKKKGMLIPQGKKERIKISDNYEETLQYTAELIEAIFEKNKIDIEKSGYQKRLVNKNWNLILNYQNSRKLQELIPSFLLYSNNYIANQIYFYLASPKYLPPYNLSKSNQMIKKYINQHIDIKDDFFLEEGSGLSRKNKITPQAILYFLHKLAPRYEIFPKEHGAFVKTGTLTGVYNLAGYIPYKKKLYPFCVFINNKKNQRIEILSLLKKWLILHYS